MIGFLMVDTEALVNKSNTDMKTKPTNTEQDFIRSQHIQQLIIAIYMQETGNTEGRGDLKILVTQE